MAKFTTAETARRMTQAAMLLRADESQLSFMINSIECCALDGKGFFIIEDYFDSSEPRTILSADTVENLKALGYSIELVPVKVGALYDINTKISW